MPPGDETAGSDRFFTSMPTIRLGGSAFATCATEISAIDDHMVQLGRGVAVGAHAMHFTNDVNDKRFVAVLKVVIAPAAAHDPELGGDQH